MYNTEVLREQTIHALNVLNSWTKHQLRYVKDTEYLTDVDTLEQIARDTRIMEDWLVEVREHVSKLANNG